ncbi:MAG: hypothetical protein QOD57_3484 [Actinomycetota bacterium]|jgi:hypothetical protein|nr:hypothetical protein [Actinomycetota bacterium]MDQ1505757.1 hypothetical protein [Actinomycetota bacterium]
MPSFSFNWNTITFSEAEGQVDATITLEGTAEGFGTVLATLVAHGAGTPSGNYDFLAVSFPETGEQVIGRGNGEWRQVAADRWESSGPTTLSTGDTVKGEGVFDLPNRTWSGTFA